MSSYLSIYLIGSITSISLAFIESLITIGLRKTLHQMRELTILDILLTVILLLSSWLGALFTFYSLVKTVFDYGLISTWLMHQPFVKKDD